MRKFLFGLIGGGMAGTAFGFALGIFIYPFWFLSDIVATESLPPVSAAVAPATGASTGDTGNYSHPIGCNPTCGAPFDSDRTIPACKSQRPSPLGQGSG